jgi:hypothetical protein
LRADFDRPRIATDTDASVKSGSVDAAEDGKNLLEF